jgi:MSHA biogenesis protein MshG
MDDNLPTKKKEREVIYGVTDRRQDPFLVKLNDFLIDHSPVTPKEKGLFFNSLQLLVNSGVRFPRALEMLTRRSRNQRFKRVLRTIGHDMQIRGESFSKAMEKYPDIFSTSETRMIYSGEITGKIEEILDSIAIQIQKNIEIELRVKSALMYPMVVFIAILLAAVIVMVFLVPKFEALFADFGSELPLATRMLINTSNFMQAYWWLCFAIIGAGTALFKNWKKSDTGRIQWDGFILQLPLVKGLINNLQTVRIASNFSTLMRSGIPVNKALHILSEIMPNAVIGEGIFNVEMAIREGKQLHESFAKNPHFDPILSEVIEIGEKTGAVPEILHKTAIQYEREVDAQLNNLTSMLDPIIIIIVALAVVFMAMAIMVPIFKMNDLFAA